MKSLEYAELENGEKLPYIYRPDPPYGGMKHTYFSPDGTYVIQFFNEPATAQNQEFKKRMDAIIGRYNPTKSEANGGAKGNSEKLAAYYQRLFCWPQAVVKSPAFGIVCPSYPKNFFFEAGASSVLNLAGKEKKSTWFTHKNRKYLEKEERGDLKKILGLSLLLCRAVRRMHQAGLAHSDLSHNNVLIDPKTASCVVIDIDSLVVPGIFPPEVLGTKGYMAPEILSSYGLPSGHRDRVRPSAFTDLHSLSVLLYEYLFCRHPLLGPKVNAGHSAGENEFLALGPKAVFIENPNDKSNRPAQLNGTIADLGPVMEGLFLRAFADGLHHPEKRPTALEWERGLQTTMALLYPCKNMSCEQGYFVLHHSTGTKCPYCHASLKEEAVCLHFYRKIKGKDGWWKPGESLCVNSENGIFKWHIRDDIFEDENAPEDRCACIEKQGDNWFFINEKIENLYAANGRFLPVGGKTPLSHGTLFRTGDEKHSILIEVEIKE